MIATLRVSKSEAPSVVAYYHVCEAAHYRRSRGVEASARRAGSPGMIAASMAGQSGSPPVLLPAHGSLLPFITPRLTILYLQRYMVYSHGGQALLNGLQHRLVLSRIRHNCVATHGNHP